MKSLVSEINWAIVLTLVVVAILFSAVFSPYQQRQRDHFLEEHLFLLKTLKKSEERTLIDPLFEGKAEALKLQLARLGAEVHGLEAIAVFDAGGRLLADYPAGSVSGDLGPSRAEEVSRAEEGISEESKWRGKPVLIYLAPFRVVGETVGHLEIIYSLQEIVELRRTGLIFFLLLLLPLLVTSIVLLKLLLSRLVTSPIKRLVKTVEEVERGNLSARATSLRDDEIGHLNQAFNEMISRLQTGFDEIEKQNIELKELDRLKNEFLANVSHEIRTPLHAIIGFSEGMLDETKTTSENQKYLEMILESGRSLNTLVGRVLDFSQIKAGKLELQRESFKIQKVATNVLPIIQKLLGEKPVELVNRIPNDLPPVLGDPLRVQQIFLNLLENAVRFTERGRIVLTAAEKGQLLEFAVTDSGIGISPEMREFIFDEFRQGDGSTRRKYGGTGLGLAIVKQLVTLHGGEIWLESEEGKGSSFHFTLPRA